MATAGESAAARLTAAIEPATVAAMATAAAPANAGQWNRTASTGKRKYSRYRSTMAAPSVPPISPPANTPTTPTATASRR